MLPATLKTSSACRRSAAPLAEGGMLPCNVFYLVDLAGFVRVRAVSLKVNPFWPILNEVK